MAEYNPVLHLVGMSWVFRQMRAETRAGDIDSTAAVWAARADRGLSPREQTELSAWLGLDSRHVGAFARAQAMLSPVSPGVAAVVNESRNPPVAAGKRPLRAMLVAASVLVVGAVAVTMASGPVREDEYTTARGEVRTVPLADGSRITFNTSTDVDVALSDARRELTLRAGEAYFEVASDKSRPFVVNVDKLDVTAVGTAFIVRRLDDGDAEVIVHEGVVELKGEAGESIMLEANARAVIEDRRRVRITTLDSEGLTCSLAWRDGKIAFTGETLAQAVDEFNRYNALPIELGNDGLANRKVTGWFSSRDPEAFARAIALSFEGQVDVYPDRIKLSAR